MGREKELERELVKSLRDAGATVLKVHGHAMQEPGWPDVQVYHPAWCGHLELKSRGGRPTPLQLHRARELASRSFPAVFVRGEARGELEVFDHDFQLLFSTRARGRQLLDSLARATAWMRSS